MPTRMCAWRSWAMRWGSEPQEMKQERRKTEKESDERKSVPAACHVHRRIIFDDGGDRPVGKIAAGGVAHQLHPPYAMTCIWGIEMGKATILLHCSLVLLQIILLRRNFKPVNLLQVAVGIVFGYFTTFCNWCVSFLPESDGIVLRGHIAAAERGVYRQLRQRRRWHGHCCRAGGDGAGIFYQVVGSTV